jgi:hypothetical protein
VCCAPPIAERSFRLDEVDDVVETLADAQIGHDERSCSTHAMGVTLHHFE